MIASHNGIPTEPAPSPVAKRPVSLVIVTRGDDLLGLTRGCRWHDWHLPGGKLEPGESSADAACRELEEETGVILVPAQLSHVCNFTTGSGRWAVAYLATAPEGAPDKFEATSAGQPAWVPPSALLQPWCSFVDECTHVLESAGLVCALHRPHNSKRYHDALCIIARGCISPAIDFSRLVLMGDSVRDAFQEANSLAGANGERAQAVARVSLAEREREHGHIFMSEVRKAGVPNGATGSARR